MVLNIQNFLEKSRFHITYITLDISYNDDKKVRIRKIHKCTKTEELRKSKYKIDENETYIYDNQIDLDLFLTEKWNLPHIFRKSHLNLENEEFKTQQKDTFKDVRDVLNEKIITQQKNTFRDSKEFSTSGIEIYVSIKNPDEQLIDNLCNIIHQLCKKYLKTSIIYTVKDGIMCRIDDYSYSENVLKKFLEDFVVITEKTILKEI